MMPAQEQGARCYAGPGDVNRLVAAREDPPKPLSWPNASGSPSAARPGTNALKGPHNHDFRCGRDTPCHGGVPRGSTRAQTAGLDFTSLAQHSKGLWIIKTNISAWCMYVQKFMMRDSTPHHVYNTQHSKGGGVA